MNLDDLTLSQIKQLQNLGGTLSHEKKLDNGMIEEYVIVRCRDAGVHAGYLESHIGRECVLKNSRRLWYWKPANGKAFLSGVANEGLDASSKVGAPLTRHHLTENCEIILCTEKATKSVSEAPEYVPE
ncbi:MAG: DUF6948 domain-containing protein [Desulfobulbia bacterium]